VENLLILLHTDTDGTLPKLALEALGAARQLACSLKESTFAVGLAGREVQQAANAIVACGAGRFLGVEGEEFGQPRYSTDAAAAEALCRAADASIVLAPGTSRWNRVLAGVAQRLGGRVDTHVVALGVEEGKLSLHRWYYRQRMEATLTRSRRPWMILLDSGACPAWRGEPGEAEVRMLPVATSSRTTVLGIESRKADQQTIRPDASLLFVAGAGWTKKQRDGLIHTEEAAELITEFVRGTQCSLGSSKSLVELTSEGQPVLPFLTHLHQVGQTGSTPRHPKGLATCCHGEEPHVVGWRFINERRAINLDANCGWARGKADVLYVADAFEVMRKVRALLAKG
jgi:electron transfer flavoprotein alpha subunit